MNPKLAAFVALLVAMSPLELFVGTARADDRHGWDDLEIRTLSTRPDTVTGGDVLVAIDVPRRVGLRRVEVRLNGKNVTSAFRRGPGHSLLGLVKGLALGHNALEARARGDDGGHSHAKIELTNYPISGPVFSGPHEQPFICETQNFNLPAGLGNLGPALDADCSIVTRVDYIYRSTAGTLKPLTSTSAYPADLARTTTSTGRNVPYIVRLETGTINRAIYQLALLHDAVAEATPDPWSRPAGWNRRVIYTFGGGCINGWYRQGASTGGVTDDVMLRQGYAVASASLNVFGNNCQELTAAETMMMVKERFVEAYGPPVYTIGWGCSGGSYQQTQIADNYPGLLDGILPGCSFPEVGFATVPFITDARLLNRYFNTVAAGTFAPEEQRQVTGFLTLATMPNVSVGAGRISPTQFCPSVLPVALRYHPVTNPGGARCDVYDHTVNVYGRDPLTGFALRPLDNVGIQYGLGALNSGAITKAQFITLNAGIGGYDQDGNFQAARNAADLRATRAAYRSGRLTNGGLGLSEIPIIDYRAYTDDLAVGDVHLRYHSFSMRERLIAANGHADNQVMVVEDFRFGFYSSASPLLQHALRMMDEWLANLARDRSHHSKIVKILRAKPAGLVEGCMTRDANPQFIAEPLERTHGQCATLYSAPPAPREVAGASVKADVIKCRLKRPDPADYAVGFSDAEWAQLRAVFPSGVCDYSRRGVAQQPPKDTWLAFPRPGKIVRLNDDRDDDDHGHDRDD